MQKNVLIGNGVNIQYGGKDVYSNEAILKRMVENIRDGKYCHLLPDCSIGEQLNFFEKLHDLLVNIGQCNPPEVYLFLLKEVERIKIVATDGATSYMRETIDAMDEKTFEMWLKYHFTVCERMDLIGATSHSLDILRKR